MALSANLEASFGADGFDLGASFSGIAGLFTGVDLPALSLDTPGTVDLGDVSLDGVLGAVGDVSGVIGGALDGFPDVMRLLGPLQSGLAVLDLAGTDFG